METGFKEIKLTILQGQIHATSYLETISSCQFGDDHLLVKETPFSV